VEQANQEKKHKTQSKVVDVDRKKESSKIN
jgi:hypothetical protein